MTLFMRTLSFAMLSLLFVAGCDTGDPTADSDPLPDRYVIPGDGVFPEGIALDDGDETFYVGSVPSGTIYRGALDGDTLTVFSDGPASAIGLALGDGRLWVAGGGTGQAYTVSLSDGAVQTTFAAPAPAEGDSTFVNDVALAADTAYVTDSFRPVLFRAAASADAEAELEPWLDLTGTPIAYQAGFNLNGIAATPDGQYLLVVQSNTGQLFRIDVTTQAVQAVDLGGDALTNGDGLLLAGTRTLYVVQNQQGVVTRVDLGEDYLSGSVAGSTDGGNATLRFPTTIAATDGDLLVVNGQLDALLFDGDLELPFTVSRIDAP